MSKKLAIVGQGTAGSFAVTHFIRWSDWDIDWYYDSDTPTQAVGEGSNLVFPSSLYENVGFTYIDLDKLDGSFKLGIDKQNWGGTDYTHTFAPPFIGCHFNAKKFQSYVVDGIKNNSRIKLIDKKIQNPHDIDADYVMDCSGKPSNLDLFETNLAIPVNSVHVTQCYWDRIEFQKTLTIARPYGWVFGIPLKNRCSIGYLYNNNINTLEEVKEDVKEIFSKYNLTPSQDTNTFTFGNYYRKNNFDGKVVYNGNASFFLEPLEATSIHFMNTVQKLAINHWNEDFFFDCDYEYQKQIKQVETMIMLHYYAGSKFNTSFWNFAQEKATRHIENAIVNDNDFRLILKCALIGQPSNEFGTWGIHSFAENLKGLGLIDKISALLDQ